MTTLLCGLVHDTVLNSRSPSSPWKRGSRKSRIIPTLPTGRAGLDSPFNQLQLPFGVKNEVVTLFCLFPGIVQPFLGQRYSCRLLNHPARRQYAISRHACLPKIDPSWRLATFVLDRFGLFGLIWGGSVTQKQKIRKLGN